MSSADRSQSVGTKRARHERKCRRPAAALPPCPPPLLSTRAPPSSGGLGRVEERGRREVPLGGLARRNNRRLRHALRLDGDAPPLALGAGHLAHPLDPRGGRDVRAKQVVGERAADIVVGLAAEDVVALVVLVDVLEVGRVAQPLQRPARRAILQLDWRQAVHGRVEHVPHQRVHQHARQKHGKRLEQSKSEQRKHGQRARQHLDRHHPGDRPREGGAASNVRVERSGRLGLPPALVLLEGHVVVRLGVVLDVSPALELDQVGPPVRQPHRPVLEHRQQPLEEAVEGVVAVKLLVLIPAVGGVLVEAHQHVQHRHRDQRLADAEEHCRLRMPSWSRRNKRPRRSKRPRRQEGWRGRGREPRLLQLGRREGSGGSGEGEQDPPRH
mmetsp:Transcript_2865/g.8476  ORF Transcript_2865/g.8476 Transcript_2865/m.8476 type:complete len:384 (+) Transcript_2865:68-1219(+)